MSPDPDNPMAVGASEPKREAKVDDRYKCGCGVTFESQQAYEKHLASEHLQE